jgi:hypothetical protein
METQFSLDAERFKRFERTLPAPHSPEETFRRRSGIYIDSALFIKETLNRIHPSYGARVVVIILRPYGSNHYACSFIQDRKTYVMDYGTPYREITGLHGPFDHLDGYRKFFEKTYPLKKRVEAVRYLN